MQTRLPVFLDPAKLERLVKACEQGELLCQHLERIAAAPGPIVYENAAVRNDRAALIEAAGGLVAVRDPLGRRSSDQLRGYATATLARMRGEVLPKGHAEVVFVASAPSEGLDVPTKRLRRAFFDVLTQVQDGWLPSEHVEAIASSGGDPATWSSQAHEALKTIARAADVEPDVATASAFFPTEAGNLAARLLVLPELFQATGPGAFDLHRLLQNTRDGLWDRDSIHRWSEKSPRFPRAWIVELAGYARHQGRYFGTGTSPMRLGLQGEGKRMDFEIGTSDSLTVPELVRRMIATGGGTPPQGFEQATLQQWADLAGRLDAALG